MEKTYRISELFYSLQGEGYWTGKSAVFIRLSGCNLQCAFCDTDHSATGNWTAKQIADFCGEYKRAGMIIITGGEPMIQIDENLIKEIKNATAGAYIAIETNGTIEPSPELQKKIDWVVCSPKNIEQLRPELINWVNEFKFLINDYFLMYKKKFIDFALVAALKNKKIYLQPCDEDFHKQLNTEKAVKLVKEYGDVFRLSLQTQKILNIK